MTTMADTDGADTATRVRVLVARIAGVSTVGDDLDLFEAGLLNSLHALQLVQSLESTFDFEVADADLNLVHFRTVPAIVALVERSR